MKKARKKAVTLAAVANLVTEAHEGLARSIAEGFRGVDRRFEEVDKRFDEARQHLEQQVRGVNNRIDDLALNRATREEMKVLDRRVSRIETKLGLDFKPRQPSA